MKWSLNLGSIAGIKILVHWTFLILLGWVVFVEAQRGSSYSAIMFTLAFVLAIFVCVVLHELGHALTARRYGIETKRITLLPIGGVASLERMPEEPKKELLIAVAGPAVNVAIAVLLLPLINFNQIIANAELQAVITAENFVFSLFTINIILVVFNAIPAFPMDGGRVLRALLAMKLDRVKATAIAARLGQILAAGFFFLGLLYNPFLVLIGIFVFFGAYSENMIVQHLELLKGYTVKDAMMTKYAKLTPESTLKDAVDLILAGSDNHIVIEEEGKVVGVVSRKILIEGLKDKNTERKISEIMTKDFIPVQATDKLTDIYSKAQRKRSNFFPVVENGHVAGAIDMENINEFVMIQSSLNY